MNLADGKPRPVGKFEEWAKNNDDCARFVDPQRLKNEFVHTPLSSRKGLRQIMLPRVRSTSLPGCTGRNERRSRVRAGPRALRRGGWARVRRRRGKMSKMAWRSFMMGGFVCWALGRLDKAFCQGC